MSNFLRRSRMITETEYNEIRSRLDKHNAWIDSIRSKRKCRKCRGEYCSKCDGTGIILGWASYKPEDKPEDVPEVSNAERSAVELYEFMRDKPRRYFAYVRE